MIRLAEVLDRYDLIIADAMRRYESSLVDVVDDPDVIDELLSTARADMLAQREQFEREMRSWLAEDQGRVRTERAR
jgi:hypothetical protein